MAGVQASIMSLLRKAIIMVGNNGWLFSSAKCRMHRTIDQHYLFFSVRFALLFLFFG